MNFPAFRHEAMATAWQITVAGQAPRYAQQAATAAWRELDRLESELSRYIESSDIARVNRLAEGEATIVGEAAFECLRLAAEMQALTRGAFDATYASEPRGHGAATPQRFDLDPAAHTVISRTSRLHVDLGAIGKGFALDRLAGVLREWDVTSACLHSGGSTALAVGAPPGALGWPVGLGDDPGAQSIALVSAALSGSGTAVKGEHIVDPRAGGTGARRERVWSLAPQAAVADALSTAFFVFADTEIAAFCAAHPEFGAAVARGESLTRHGALA